MEPIKIRQQLLPGVSGQGICDAHQIIFIADVTRGWGAQLLFQLDSLLVFTSLKIMNFTASNYIFLNVWGNVENPLVPSVLHTRVCT